MTTAYEEVIAFVSRGMTRAELLSFQPSGESCARFEQLIRQEKTDGLLPEEREELEQMMEVERVLSLAKAKARAELSSQGLLRATAQAAAFRSQVRSAGLWPRPSLF